MNTVRVLGLGLGREDLTPRHLELIASAQVLAGGRRQLALLPGHSARELILAHNLGAWLDEVATAARSESVVVLASGDPGFHGIAARLVERLGADRVEIWPNLSTVQAAFARLKEPWQEAAVVSLHGKGEAELWPALARAERVAVYTDPSHDPAFIARLLLERGQDYWDMVVLEDLGAERERVGVYPLEAAAGRSFSPLNLVVLRRKQRPRTLRLGLAEEMYEHQGGLITKAEVRVTALAKLELGPGLNLWDLGAGCGSLGIEASLLIGGGAVTAVECDPARAQQIRANRRRFGVGCLEVVQARLPQGLDGLADPDRVFLGGGGAELGRIITQAWARLPLGGVLVAAVVLLESLHAARGALAEQGAALEVTQLQVSRSARLGEGSFLRALNPVWLVKSVKES
jgi:precorrin-6Y C5,15-methyltransferase (decarboxylating)